MLYVSFGSKVRPRTFGCVAWVVLCCLLLGPDCSYILQGLVVNRVQVVLSGFNKRLFCFVQAKLCVGMVVCISWLHSYLCVWL